MSPNLIFQSNKWHQALQTSFDTKYCTLRFVNPGMFFSHALLIYLFMCNNSDNDNGAQVKHARFYPRVHFLSYTLFSYSWVTKYNNNNTHIKCVRNLTRNYCWNLWAPGIMSIFQHWWETWVSKRIASEKLHKWPFIQC